VSPLLILGCKEVPQPSSTGMLDWDGGFGEGCPETGGTADEWVLWWVTIVGTKECYNNIPNIFDKK
jgi:hypothetical protein